MPRNDRCCSLDLCMDTSVIYLMLPTTSPKNAYIKGNMLAYFLVNSALDRWLVTSEVELLPVADVQRIGLDTEGRHSLTTASPPHTHSAMCTMSLAVDVDAAHSIVDLYRQLYSLILRMRLLIDWNTLYCRYRCSLDICWVFLLYPRCLEFRYKNPTTQQPN